MSSSNRRSIDSLESALSPESTHTAYPFPRIDGAQRVPSTPRSPGYRRGSFASVSSIGSPTTSIGGSLDIRPSRTDGVVKEVGQNAISNLLQPPIARTGLLPHATIIPPGYKAPTTRDIPPVTLTNIRHVEPSAFHDYLSRIGPLFDSIAMRREDKEPPKAREEDNTSAPSTPRGDRFNRPNYSRQNSLALPSPVSERTDHRRRSSAHSRRRLNEPTPLSTVPSVYFEGEFHLENPRTFDIVSERAEIIRPATATNNAEKSMNGAHLPPRKALATNAILQEKLSWYMDTVEVHLINSISEASSSFFAALGSLRDLQHEAEESAAQIRALRADLAELDRGMVSGGLEIARRKHRRNNVEKLCQATIQVQHIVQQVVKCEELVDEGKYEDAVDGIAAAENLICGRPARLHVAADNELINGNTEELYDLRDLRVLQNLSSGMQQLHSRIGKGFELRFLEILMTDLRIHVAKVPRQDTIRRWVNASQRNRGDPKLLPVAPSYLDTGQDFRKALAASLIGLDKANHTSLAAEAFQQAIAKEVKALIRKHLPSSNDDDIESVTSVATRGGSRSVTQQEKSAILARNLRALDEQDAEALLIAITTGVSEALRRLSTQTKVLLDVSSSGDKRSTRATSPEPMSSPVHSTHQSMDTHLRTPSGITSPIGSPRLQEILMHALDMSSLLGQAVDIAQTQLVRVLKVRAEQTHKLPLERFVRYFTLLRLFADECEAISGRSGQALKNILNTQLTAFVAYVAENEGQKIAHQLESDRWEAQDVHDKDQALLSKILDGMNSDPESWRRGTRIWEETIDDPGHEHASTNGTSSTSEQTDAKPAKVAARPAYIDETRFVLVKSAMAILPTLDVFLALIASVPNIATVAVPALCDVLRTFNSRSSQLILGAGATRVSGLKNITTKHLALSSQALSFVIALIPYIREAVRRHVGGRTESLSEFDKVKRLFQDHQMGIHDKLVEIMGARARSHSNAMRKIDFDNDDGEGPSGYMETLTKETGTLHRVLNKHLQEGDVLSIMMQIARTYREVWTKGFAETSVSTTKGKTRLLKDAELFDSRLSKIEGFADIAKSLLDNVTARNVEIKAVEQEKVEVLHDADASAAEGYVKKESPHEEAVKT